MYFEDPFVDHFVNFECDPEYSVINEVDKLYCCILVLVKSNNLEIKEKERKALVGLVGVAVVISAAIVFFDS
jgi:hypothetical protein